MKIVECVECGTKNRIKPHSNSLCPVCGKCGSTLPHIRSPSTLALFIWNSILLLFLGAVVCGILLTPSLINKDFSDIIAAEEKKTATCKREQEKILSELEEQLREELSQIDAEKLKLEANLLYERIYNTRKSYDSRYALTPREKTQLRMQELSSDSTKSYSQTIVAIAKEASPKSADVRTSVSFRGIDLDIEFDMSSMTSGEHGTRTKHHTKDSLKKEVISLISRATNDIFLFCKNLELNTIHVGCRHHVNVDNPNGTKQVENMILYKILIKKSRIQNLSSNPFLDVYSTSQYLEVEEDNFSEIEIVTTRI